MTDVVKNGGTARFHATVNRAEGISYQWYYNGRKLLSQSRDTLTISGVRNYHEGVYEVQACENGKCVWSEPAVLSIDGSQPQYVSMPLSTENWLMYNEDTGVGFMNETEGGLNLGDVGSRGGVALYSNLRADF